MYSNKEYMKNIVLKSRADLEKNSKRPFIEDIISFKGFLRYFAYRNTFPGIRDLLYFIFDTLQIYFIFMFLDKGAATGGVVGYVSVLLISSLWNVMLYSMREKILELESKKQLGLVPNYFAPMVFSGFVIWLLMALSAIILIRLNTAQGSVIFISRLLAGSFDLYSSLYFFSVYTLYRVYIPFTYTLLNRLFFLFLPLIFVKYFGVTAFIFSFFAEKIVNTLLTIKYCNKTLRSRNMNLIADNFTDLLMKNSFWFIKENPLGTIKRAFSSSLFGLQKFIVIVLVHNYYNFYIIDFFVFYQIIHLFMLLPLRMSKSMYHDVTQLLYKKKYYLLRILFNNNMILSLLFAAISVYLFSIIPAVPIPRKIFSLIFEFLLLDQWQPLYMLIFFSYGISLINRLLFVSEAHVWLISTSLFFDYFLLGTMLWFSPYFFKLGNPMLFFSFQGRLSLFYFVTLLIIYASGLWKKESVLTKIRDSGKVSLSGLLGRKTFLELTKEKGGKDSVVVVLTLSKKYINSSFINGIIELASERLNIIAVTRFSNNTLFFFVNKSEVQGKEFEMLVLSILGIYSDRVVLSAPERLVENIFFPVSINVMYPKMYLPANESDIKSLSDIDSKYIEHSIYNVKNSPRKKEVIGLFSIMNGTYFVFPENVILKKAYIGLIPIVNLGKTEKILEFSDSIDPLKIKKIIRLVLMRDLYLFLSEISNG